MTLVNTAALEALTAPKAAPDAKTGPPATAECVSAFVAEVSNSARTEESDTHGDNVNDYQESAKGYGAKTRLKSAPNKSSAGGTPAAAAPAKAVDLSVDLLAK